MLRTFKKIPYKLDIFIVTTILIISIIERVHIDLTFYRAGLTNSHTYAFIPLIFLYELLKIAVVLFAVIRISFYLMPEKKHKKYIITALLSIAIFIGYWILLITFFEPGAVYFLKGFEKWISKNVDIVAIQTWFLSEEADKYSQNADKYVGRRYDRDHFSDELPDFITNFDPEFIVFHGYDSEKGKCIEFEWYNFDTNWGIVVGSPTMKTKQEGIIKHTDSYYEFRHPIKPGVYIFSAG